MEVKDSPLVNMKVEDVSNINEKESKFSSRITIPLEVILTTEGISNDIFPQDNNLKPFFGLDLITTGMRDGNINKEKEQEELKRKNVFFEMKNTNIKNLSQTFEVDKDTAYKDCE